MIKIILQLILFVSLPIMLISSTSFAADNTTSAAASQVCQGVGTASGSGSGCGSTSTTSLNGLIAFIIDLLSVIVGVVAVIMIVVAGFRFVVSGGESQNVAGARNTIIYVIVGLVVVALAQIIVHFVLHNVAAKI